MEMGSNWYVDTEGTVRDSQNRKEQWTLTVRASALCHGVTPPIKKTKKDCQSSYIALLN